MRLEPASSVPGQQQADNACMHAAAKSLFWSKARRLTAWLLALWLLVNLVVPWFARQLDTVRGFGFSAGYWLAAEGALLVYLAIIVVYVLRMDRLESQLLATAPTPQPQEPPEPPSSPTEQR